MTAMNRPLGLCACLAWAALLFPAGAGLAQERTGRPPVERRLVVHGAGKAASRVFVLAEIQGKGTVPPGVYTLKREDGGTAAPAEVFERAGKTLIACSLEPDSSGGTSAYILTGPDLSAAGKAIAARDLRAGKVPILAGGQPLTTYISDDGPKPYYFPVIGPTGESFTRAFPMKSVEGEDRDHPHQRSFWFTHGNVNGFDFWASDPRNKPNPRLPYGSIKETSRAVVHNGRSAAVIRTTDDWLDHDGKKICEDERLVGFYGIGDTRVIDFDIALKATAGPVTFGDTKEGMFGLRLASSMDVKKKKGGKITNAEGIHDTDAWGKASPWVDYTGPVDGKTVGVAILNHPDSFRYPTHWHVRDYGLFAANPFGLKDFNKKSPSGEHTLKPGESIQFHYRVILHEGDTDSAHVGDAFQAYAKPPTIEVVAK